MGNNGVTSMLNIYSDFYTETIDPIPLYINQYALHPLFALPLTNQYTFQVVAAYMMIDSLNKKGYNAYAISIPSPSDLMTIFGLAAPVFVMMMSKVCFVVLDSTD